MSFPILVDSDFEFLTIRASGPGGQRVNKVETAVQLRFRIKGSSLKEFDKEKNKAVVALDNMISYAKIGV